MINHDAVVAAAPTTESTKPAGSKRPLVFLAVGIGNTLFDFTTYTLLTQTLFKHGSVALAGIISGTLALMVAFLAHSFITWRGADISHRTALKFVAFTGFGMWIIRPLLLTLFIKLTSLYDFVYDVSRNIGLPFSHSFVASTGAFGFMIVLLLVYNYAVYDRFVFGGQPGRTAHTAPENHSSS